MQKHKRKQNKQQTNAVDLLLEGRREFQHEVKMLFNKEQIQRNTSWKFEK